MHHPFLLPEYPLPRSSGGVPYHKKFSATGLTPEFAAHVSFVELLDVPTTGRTDTKLFWQLFNVEHARRLDQLFRNGSGRVVLLSNNVILRMLDIKKRHGLFLWLPSQHGQGLIRMIGQTEVHKVMHFSASVSHAQLRATGDLIRRITARKANEVEQAGKIQGTRQEGVGWNWEDCLEWLSRSHARSS